jgi:methionyl-tRNA formyltransferase
MVVRALDDAGRGLLAPVAQPEEGVTYAHKIAKAEAAIDWALSAAAIERRVRAFDPFPGAAFALGGEQVKVWRAAVEPLALPAPPGTVVAADERRLVVACGADALALVEVQRPGGKRQPVAAWLQSRPAAVGDLLG